MKWFGWLLFLVAWVEAKELKIAIVSDSPYEEIATLRNLLEAEIVALMEGEYDVHFSSREALVGNNRKSQVQAALQQAYQESWDVVIALGVIASYEATQMGPLPTPTIAPLILGIDLQNPPMEGNVSGVKNLNYLTYPNDIHADIRLLKEIAPLKHLAILGRETIVQAIPGGKEAMASLGQLHDITISFSPLDAQGNAHLDQLPQGVDAVFYAVLPGMNGEEIQSFAKELIEHKLPSFSLNSDPFIADGLLVSLSPKTNLKRLFRRVAINVQRITLREDPGTFPVYISTKEQLSINTDTAKMLGLDIPFKLLIDAELFFDPTRKWHEPLTMKEAVLEGMENNTQLASKWRSVTAGAQVVQLAKSQLKPQVNLGTQARIIDRSRANKTLGFPQTLVTGAIGFDQMIYSNALIGAWCIERDVQRARVDDFHNFYLQTVRDIAVAYLETLRAETILSIQRNNLRLSRFNLLLAEQRVEVGLARASEVYRWETQIANNRTNLIEAAYQIKAQQTKLARLLDRDQAKGFELVPVEIGGDKWLVEPDWFTTKFNTEKSLERLAQFTVGLGQQLSPRLHQLWALMCSKATQLGVATRAFWTPDFFITGELNDRWYQGGAGSKANIFRNINWEVALNITFPFYDGGGKMAEEMRAKQELIQAKYDVENQYELIEQNVRVTLFQAAASHAAINLTYDAFVAATKNLELITNAYSQGTTSIIDLLDAQNQALVAELEHAEAIYGFLIDSVELQKEVGLFDFLLEEGEKEYYREALLGFFKEGGL